MNQFIAYITVRRYLYDFSISYEDTNFQAYEGGGVVKSKIFSALPSLKSFSKVRQYKIEPLLPSSLPFSLPSKFSCNVNVHMRAGSDPIRSDPCTSLAAPTSPSADCRILRSLKLKPSNLVHSTPSARETPSTGSLRPGTITTASQLPSGTRLPPTSTLAILTRPTAATSCR